MRTATTPLVWLTVSVRYAHAAVSPNALVCLSCVGRNDVWLAIWYTYNRFGADFDIVFARSVPGSQGRNFSDIQVIASALQSDTGHDLDADVAGNAEGVFVAVWSSTGSFGEALGSDFDIVFARSEDDGVTWSAVSALHSHMASDDGADIKPIVRFSTSTPCVCVCVWQSSATLNGTAGSDEDVLYAYSLDAGVSWSAPAALSASMLADTTDDTLPSVLALPDAQPYNGSRFVALFGSEAGATGDPDVYSSETMIGVCGNGIVECGERCDPGGPYSLAAWGCCSEHCTLLSNATVCRAAVDADCDVAELCNGTSALCPPDDFVAQNVSCDTAAVCTARVCDGLGTCLPPHANFCICGDGVRSGPEECDDGNTLAGDCCSPTCLFEPATTVCRAATSACDKVENCTGVSSACPADGFKAAGDACEDGDYCTGGDICDALHICQGGTVALCHPPPSPPVVSSPPTASPVPPPPVLSSVTHTTTAKSQKPFVDETNVFFWLVILSIIVMMCVVGVALVLRMRHLRKRRLARDGEAPGEEKRAVVEEGAVDPDGSVANEKALRPGKAYVGLAHTPDGEAKTAFLVGVC